MENTLSLSQSFYKYKALLIDLLALTFIYLVPAISHLFAYPIYYFEPMRIAVMASIIFTNKKNAFLLAATIPIFSFLISSHPSAYKAMLLGIELILNVGLFYYLIKKMDAIFIAALASIIISKIVYYGLKLLFLEVSLLEGALVTTPLIYQAIVTVILSFAVYLLLGKKELKK